MTGKTNDWSIKETVVDDDTQFSQEISRTKAPLEISHILHSKPSDLKIMHLNTQSVTSTFNEFLLIINGYPSDVITLSETWLKSNLLLMEFVSAILGYATEFRHRDDIWGGGVGAYIEDIVYKRRRDIENVSRT